MSSIKRRIPKVLAEELQYALRGFPGLTNEQRDELLAKWRRNRVRYIAIWGVHPERTRNTARPVGLEPIPIEYLYALERLDVAWQRFHKYMDGGFSDYIAKDVCKAAIKESNRENSALPRPDGLTRLIIEILKSKTTIRPAEMLHQLRMHVRGDVIDDINDTEGVIEWHDDTHPAESTPFSAIKHRMSRARKYLT